MRLLRRLDVRLLGSYLAIIAVSLTAMVLTLQILAPSEFEAQIDTIGRQYGFEQITTVPETTTTVPFGEMPGSTTGPSSSTPGDLPTTVPTSPGPGDGPGGTDGPGGPGSGPGGTGGPGGGGGGSGGDGSPGAGTGGPSALGVEAVALPVALAQQGPRGVESTTIQIDLEEAFGNALDAGLWTALAASIVLAGALAAFSSRRILNPLRDVRLATRRLAEGRYDERVPLPREAELAELAGDVNALGEALQTTELQRSRLMSDLAHELRTPLTTIQGYMEGLIDGVFEPTPEVFAEVAEEASRLKRLTADLALLSRAEEGALVLDLRPMDLGRAAAGAAERLRPQFVDKGVELSIGPMPDMTVDGDADRLAQVFTNLAGNALVHTPEGGRVWLTAEVNESTCAVSVHDTGEGIPRSELDQIFDRFHRVEGAGVVYAGSGIGLTISRKIVRAHGGEVSADSAGPGRGATFTVRLPIVAP